jgi:hypothetical protein
MHLLRLLSFGLGVETAFLLCEQLIQFPDECNKTVLLLLDFDHGAQLIHAFSLVGFHDWWDVPCRFVRLSVVSYFYDWVHLIQSANHYGQRGSNFWANF